MRTRSLLLLLLIVVFNQPLFSTELIPYFQYQKENLEFLRHLKTEQASFSANDLRSWDKTLEQLSNSSEVGDKLRMTTYLWEAQRDFAALANEFKGEIAGSIDLLSSQIISLFYPEFKSSADNRKYDPFTIALTDIVLSKVRERLLAENKNIRPAELHEYELCWSGKKPYFGERVPSFKPWHLRSADEFRAPKLLLADQEYWKKQIVEVHKRMKNVDQRKNEAIFYWANKRGHGSGDWVEIAMKYTDSHAIPIEKLIRFRADFSATLLDAMIATCDSKYAFLVRRPSMMDPSIKTVIDVPNHPSYPSGHSTVSAAAAEVLSVYFPKNDTQWRALAEEAGYSRIWAGIHFPVDHEEGIIMGKKVAKKALKQKT
jgi:hypothetical protein